MSGIYPKRGRLYFRLKVGGKWVGIATEFKVGQERQARAMLDRLEVRQAAGEVVAPGSVGPPTVAGWLPAWLKSRQAHVQTWRNDDSVMRLHVVPMLGHRRLDEVRPKHLVDLVRSWRARTGNDTMAPKSIYNAYSTVSAYFRDAALEDLIASTPCVLTKHQLGPKVDSDPEFRAQAQFGRAELEQLISDDRVPLDRRVFYALEGVAGLRLGEVSGLLWRNTSVPVPEHPGSLDMLLVAFSYGRAFPKGAVTRPVPVHPVLAAVLATWRLRGYEAFTGRKPLPDDLVLPYPPGTVTKRGPWRIKDWVRERFVRDLETLGLRHRRGHDLRRTCISLARSDGAQKDIHKRTTHKPPREVIEGYTTFEWPVVCREVLKFQMKLRDAGKLIEMPRAVAANGPGVPAELATAFATGSRRSEENWSGPPRTRTQKGEPGLSLDSEVEHGDSGPYDADASRAPPVEQGSADASGSTVANALADLLTLGSTALDPEHPAMKRAAAVLPARWKAKR